ncbi:MAG: TonB-dependent receptor [Pseudomonadales bacterium]
MPIGMAQAEQANDARALEEIVVTAQKRQQSILDVGIDVTALDAATIDEGRVLKMRDLEAHVPNLNIRENAPGIRPVITIRGVGLNDFSATNNPSAGVYIDEVFLSSLVLMAFDFFDLERIEVLKGPQGTLYGRNSTAGAINFFTARPAMGEHGFELATSYGNFDTWEVEAAGNVALSDSVSARMSAKTIQQKKGFYYNRTIDDDIGDRDVVMWRAQLRWNPSDDVDVNLKVMGGEEDSTLGQGAFFGARDFGNAPSFACAAIARGATDPNCTDFFGYSDPDGDPFKGDWAEQAFYDADQYGATLTVNLGMWDFAELTSVTGYLEADQAAYQDLDATPRVQGEFIPTTDIEQFSQELRLTGTTAGGSNWILGAVYSNDEIEVGSTGFFNALFRTQTDGFGDQDTESAAIFGHAELPLTDSLSVVTGLRYTWEEKSYRAQVRDTNPTGTSCLLSLTCTPGPTPPVTLASADSSIDDKNWSWKLGLEWTPTPRSLAYASVSRGNKSGGYFFGFTTSSTAFEPYEPERLIAYEIGGKLRTADGTLQLGASAFYYDYSDVQTFIRDTSSVVAAQRLGNVDEAELYGADLQAAWQPPMIPGLTLKFGVGLLETELGGYTALTGPVSRGNELPNAPSVTVNALARYERAVANSYRLALQIDGNHAGATYKDAGNDPLIKGEAYEIWNARAELAPMDGNWALSVWGRNVFDEVYRVQGVSLIGLGFGYFNYNSPRTYGATLSLSF